MAQVVARERTDLQFGNPDPPIEDTLVPATDRVRAVEDPVDLAADSTVFTKDRGVALL